MIKKIIESLSPITKIIDEVNDATKNIGRIVKK